MHSEQLKGESPTTNTNYLKPFMKVGFSHYALQELSHAGILLSLVNVVSGVLVYSLGSKSGCLYDACSTKAYSKTP